MKNLNYTLCITQEAYTQEFSKASKPIYFPFSIAGLLFIGAGIGLKCYVPTMHLWTFLVACISIVELASWIVFGII